MGITVIVQMLVSVGMLVRMFVRVGMLMGVGNTVVGVRMGMGMFVMVAVITAGNMIMMNVHSIFSFSLFFHYNGRCRHCQIPIYHAVHKHRRGGSRPSPTVRYHLIDKFEFTIPIDVQKPQVVTCGSATRKEEKKMKKRKINLSDFVLIS